MIDFLVFLLNDFLKLNIIELLLAEFLFLYACPKRKLFIVRYIASIIICLLWCYYFPPMPIAWTNYYFARIGYQFLKYFSNYIVSFVCMLFCFELNFNQTLCTTSAGYAVQHMFSRFNNLFWIILTNCGVDYHGVAGRVREGLLCLVFYLFIFIALAYPAAKEKYYKSTGKHISIISVSMVICAIGLARFAETSTQAGNISADLYTIAFCIFALIIQFVLKKNIAIEEENKVMHYIVDEKDKQYRLTKETIDAINIKCHDLKHNLLDSATKEDLKEVSKAIDIYDSSIQTGNEIIDTILTEKKLLCISNDISLTCIGNASSLSFVSAGDIYSLIGNAIDNAIEACKKIKDKEKRNISIKIYELGDVTIIEIYNYYDGTLKYEDNKIVTNKKNNILHGFGLKSIKHVAQKYSGELVINTTNNIFDVTVSLKSPKKS